MDIEAVSEAVQHLDGQPAAQVLAELAQAIQQCRGGQLRGV